MFETFDYKRITMKNLNKIFILTLMPLMLLSCKVTEDQLQQQDVVKNVDPERYAGTWYEIARFPNSFEKDLAGVTATYTLRDNGKIGVLNQGYKGSLDGKLKKAKGFAKIPYPEWGGYLQVYFFWPFGADYLILELDRENYQYALIGNESKKYMWILSRTPVMKPEIYDMLVKKAIERGYDVDKLYKTPQKEQ